MGIHDDCQGCCPDVREKLQGIAALEAKLAEVTAERDFEHRCADSQKSRGDEHFATLLKAQQACDALRAEVARLRAAIEPTADNVRAYEMAGFAGDITPQDLEIQARIYARNAGKVEDVLAAINARAGEMSASGSSLRERVEAALRRMPNCTCPTTDCWNDCGPALLHAALGEP